MPRLFFFSIGAQNSFRILLDKLENISLEPREKFHIPVAFCPEILARQEAQLRIVGRLPSGKTWSPDKYIERLTFSLNDVFLFTVLMHRNFLGRILCMALLLIRFVKRMKVKIN